LGEGGSGKKIRGRRERKKKNRRNPLKKVEIKSFWCDPTRKREWRVGRRGRGGEKEGEERKRRRKGEGNDWYVAKEDELPLEQKRKRVPFGKK
jgi:hypothetical protein